MIFKFFLNRFDFFDLLEERAGHAVEAASFFTEVTAQDYVTGEMLNRMAQIEHEGDDAAHPIIQRLNKTFLTPFDRQDVHALALEMDDITDMIHNIVSRLRVYDIRGDDSRVTS